MKPLRLLIALALALPLITSCERHPPQTKIEAPAPASRTDAPAPAPQFFPQGN